MSAPETDKNVPSSADILKFSPERVLEFNVVGGNQSHVVLQLENPTDSNVAFKIKTTAPKSYLVKPSSGIVLPRSKQDVNILLIPMFEPPRDSSPDRFLVQSIVTSSTEPLSKEEWSDLARQKDTLDERRLSVQLNWLGFATTQSAPKTDVSDTLQSIIGRPQSNDHAELKAKFEELIAYSIAADKQKRELESQLDELRQQRGATSRALNTGGAKAHSGMDYWQVALLLVFVVVLIKAFQL